MTDQEKALDVEAGHEWQFHSLNLPPVQPTGLRLIDKQIAEAVFGFGWWWNETDGSHGMRVPPGKFGNPYDIDQWYSLPRFTTSWNEAGWVVERMIVLDFEPAIYYDRGKLARRWDCRFWAPAKRGIAFADTFPLAVCLAALRALGVHLECSTRTWPPRHHEPPMQGE